MRELPFASAKLAVKITLTFNQVKHFSAARVLVGTVGVLLGSVMGPWSSQLLFNRVGFGISVPRRKGTGLCQVLQEEHCTGEEGGEIL